MNTSLDNLIVGDSYRIVFQSGSKKKLAILSYMGKGFGGHQFNGRPHFGTQTFRDSDILEITAVSKQPNKMIGVK